MSEIRVFEAARRLNVDTTEILAILEKQGVNANSPISPITMEQYNAVIDVLTEQDERDSAVFEAVVDSTADDAIIPANPAIAKPEATDPVFVEPVKKEADIIPINSGRQGKEPEESMQEHEPVVAEQIAEDPPIPSDFPAVEKPSPITEAAKSDMVEAATASTTETASGSFASYLAVTIAALALIGTWATYSALSEATTRIDALSSTTSSLQEDIRIVFSKTQNQQNAINANQTAIASTRIGVIKNDLATASASLSALAADGGDQRFTDLATRIGALADSL
jgi:hypothetical protein